MDSIKLDECMECYLDQDEEGYYWVKNDYNDRGPFINRNIALQEALRIYKETLDEIRRVNN
jgi:hypothetical protein